MENIRRSRRRSARFIMMVGGKLRRVRAFREPVCRAIALACVSLTLASPCVAQGPASRPRARDIGLVVGVFEPGALDAITDVAGVRVGQTTVVEGDSVRTGVTAIIQHGGNVFQERVPAAIVVGNGFGKLAGSTEVRELGELETPVLLTCTLCVWRAADAMVGWLLEQPGMSQVRSINPVVGETNDGISTTSERVRSRRRRCDARSRRRTRARWTKARWARGRGPSHLGGRAESGPPRASSRQRSAAGPWACSCRQTSAACSR